MARGPEIAHKKEKKTDLASFMFNYYLRYNDIITWIMLYTF